MQVFFIFAIAVVFLAGLFFAHLNTKHVLINKVTVPPAKNRMRLTVLHISDLHLENISISPAALQTMVKGQSFDLIALTGDFLDRKRSIPKLVPYLEVLKDLKPRYGIYVVFGNHDYILKRENFERMKHLFEQYGCKTLQNEHVTIRDGKQTINIIGIDDFSTGRSDLEKSFANLPDGYHLVLTHDPNIVLEMGSYPFDYLLSGHFHGGQIHWPKPYHLVKMGKLARKKIIKGLNYHKGKPFYISEGLGQTGVNIRIGSRPEITFHKIGR